MHKFLGAFFAWAVLFSAIPAAWAQAIPYKPGRYSWKVSDGVIQLVAARYTNQNSFDNRAYTFYFETSDKKQLYIVPIAGTKPGDTVLTTTSAAGGDWLFTDLAVQRQGGALYLIKVRQDTRSGWAEPGDLTVERYLLKKGDDEDFPYQFVQQVKTTTPAAPRVSVDEVLKQQLKSATR